MVRIATIPSHLAANFISGHKSAFNIIYGQSKGNFPTILLNGTGNVNKFNGQKIVPDENIPQPTTLHFERGDRYLLRIINTAFDSMFLFSIDNHLLEITSADFVPIHSTFVNQLHVGIGQRYNIIVHAQPITNGSTSPIQDSGNYWIRMHYIENCVGTNPKGPNYSEMGILRYDNTSTADPKSGIWTNLDLINCKDEESLKPYVPWEVGKRWNPKETHEAKLIPKPKSKAIGKRDQVTKTYTSTYPLQQFALPTPSAVTFQPLRVDYQDITFHYLDNNNPWPNPWVVVSENSEQLDNWVRFHLSVGFR
jgi:FtsP/CotA-like multicopper oxidase with cupredoxin domain